MIVDGILSQCGDFLVDSLTVFVVVQWEEPRYPALIFRLHTAILRQIPLKQVEQLRLLGHNLAKAIASVVKIPLRIVMRTVLVLIELIIERRLVHIRKIKEHAGKIRNQQHGFFE